MVLLTAVDAASRAKTQFLSLLRLKQCLKSGIVVAVALVWFLAANVLQAAVLEISIPALGTNTYNTMVFDAKLRGDGGLADWNLGASPGDSDRFYANYTDTNGTAGSRENTFVEKFDVSSIPPGSTINSAILTNYFANRTVNTRTYTNVNVSKMRPGKDWIETFQTPPGTAGPHFDGSVTWNSQASGTTLWATPGALDATDIFLDTTKTFNIDFVDGFATTNALDITSWVQDWVNTPTNNTGILWWGACNADSPILNRYCYFGVKEDGDAAPGESFAAAPRLVIDYTSSGTISPFSLINPNLSGNTFSVSFASQSGVPYRLEYKDSVSAGTWNNGASTNGDGSVKTLTDSSATPSSRIYRVVANPNP